MEIITRSVHLLLRPDHIVTFTTKKDWNEPDTIEIARENVEGMKKLIDGKKRGLLIHVPPTHLSRDVLELYRRNDMKATAMALLTNSFGARMMSNLFLKLSGKGKTPIKMFNSEEDAVRWLHNYVG